jgi:pimeloyl-ACP methyl ester carboxylesterase
LLLPAVLAGLTEFRSQRLEQRFPPVGEFAVIDGVKLHYSVAGPADLDSPDLDSPPIVLLHGASTSLLDFHASLRPSLSREHRVIAVDRPGHGYSERPSERQTAVWGAEWPDPAVQARLLQGLLAELDVQRPVLVGHSLAGAVVLAYMLAYPDEIAGGVLLAGGSHPWVGGVAWYNDLAGLPILGPLFAYTLPLTFGSLQLGAGMADAFAPNVPPEGYLDATGVELTLRPRTFLANAEDIRRLSPFLGQQSRRYTEIRRPLLLITGDADGVVPAWNHAERLIHQAPRAELAVLPGVGHGLHHVATDRINALISEFALRAERARTPGPDHVLPPTQ